MSALKELAERVRTDARREAELISSLSWLRQCACSLEEIGISVEISTDFGRGADGYGAAMVEIARKVALNIIPLVSEVMGSNTAELLALQERYRPLLEKDAGQ